MLKYFILRRSWWWWYQPFSETLRQNWLYWWHVSTLVVVQSLPPRAQLIHLNPQTETFPLWLWFLNSPDTRAVTQVKMMKIIMIFISFYWEISPCEVESGALETETKLCNHHVCFNFWVNFWTGIHSFN